MSVERWIPYAGSPSASVRLFCFPYAGGGAATYAKWVRRVDPRISVCPVELPGRGMRFGEACVTRLDALVAQLAEALRPAFDRPFAFFGHSMGVYLAFELARHLRDRGGPEPRDLFLSGVPALHKRVPEPPVYAYPDDRFIECVRAYHATPEAVLENAELRALYLPVLRADFEVCQTYQYRVGRPLQCPLTAYGGRDDPDTRDADLLAWAELTAGRFRCEIFDGDHFYLNQPAPLLAHLSHQLLGAEARSTC